MLDAIGSQWIACHTASVDDALPLLLWTPQVRRVEPIVQVGRRVIGQTRLLEQVLSLMPQGKQCSLLARFLREDREPILEGYPMSEATLRCHGPSLPLMSESDPGNCSDADLASGEAQNC
jgi:hypothetical protein